MYHRLIQILFVTVCVSTLAGATTIFSGNFTGAFDPSNWALANDNGGDGYLVVNSSTSVSVYGADNGAGGGAGGLGNYTTFLIAAPSSGTVDVNWLYSTYDCCGSRWDPAGYQINGVSYQFTVDNGDAGVPQTGTTSFAVTAGDTFGFYVFSPDSIQGRGEITILEGVPEPSTAGYFAGGLAALWFARRRFTR